MISPPTFIDLFAGCGGFSLGLMQAGWQGLFAIERHPTAFLTLEHNLLKKSDGPEQFRYNWPDWLPKEPHDIAKFVRRFKGELLNLRGKVDLVCGGPPCQGFSIAGLRLHDDPRNGLFRFQLAAVKLLQPKFVLLENVMGISYPLGNNKVVSQEIRAGFEKLKYRVEQHKIVASDYGVPQLRPRYYTIAIHPDYSQASATVFDLFKERRKKYLEEIGIGTGQVSVKEAIGDLRTKGRKRIQCVDPYSFKGFEELKYRGPKTPYQELMNEGFAGCQPNSMRLVNHTPVTIERYQNLHNSYRKGVGLSLEDRERLGIKKHSVTVLKPDEPSKTLTTIPDDLIHFSEPRVHTVREHARLQSFPDWFSFQGKFTTGGPMRVHDCPRYTQVGNAVPPLVSRAIGETISEYLYLQGKVQPNCSPRR